METSGRRHDLGISEVKKSTSLSATTEAQLLNSLASRDTDTSMDDFMLINARVTTQASK